MAATGRVFTQRGFQNAVLSRLRCKHGYYAPNYCSRRSVHDQGSRKSTRIGCASGFWGDTAVSAPQLIKGGKIDFLVLDYLSEITMSLMTAAKKKMPNMGYAPDFVQAVVAPWIKDIKNKGVRILTNAGGVNPQACAAALHELCQKTGVHLKIAVVHGDDLMPQAQAVQALDICDIDTGTAFPQSVNSMNVYLGAGALSLALDLGADIVVTGRCTDSALVLAPLIHTYKWAPTDYDLLAAGSLAGHLIECGAQATGGIFTDWHKVPDWHNIGFPIVDVSDNGDFIVTKPPKTGGLVTKDTLSEQLVYEIGDPQNYVLPDVVCDFSNVTMQNVKGEEGNAVVVKGARGKAPTDSYKVCATYLDGYKATAVCPLAGPRAAEKGRRTADAILTRSRAIFSMIGLDDFTRTNVQILGSEESYGGQAKPHMDSREAVIWMSVHHSQKKALEIFSREIAPAGTGMAPGLCGIVGGRPKVSPLLRLYSFLYPKNNVTALVEMEGAGVEEYRAPVVDYTSSEQLTYSPPSHPPTSPSLQTGSCSYNLGQLAYTRSGDKGDSVNIGVIARHPSIEPYLRDRLTTECVEQYLAHLFSDRDSPIDSRIQRFELPGVNGFNFLLKQALGGGGVASLRSDPQGKAVGQMLLDLVLHDLPEFNIDEK